MNRAVCIVPTACLECFNGGIRGIAIHVAGEDLWVLIRVGLCVLDNALCLGFPGSLTVTIQVRVNDPELPA